VRVRCVTLCVAAAAYVLPVPGLADQGRAATVRSQTNRIFLLGAGRAVRTFHFRERSGVIIVNRLTVPHGVRAFVAARIPHLAGARVASWPNRDDPTPACHRRGAFDVCTQGEEGCPMPEATWRFVLVKLSGPAGAIRFDYVVAAPPAKA
jgi:hypothetical protein